MQYMFAVLNVKNRISAKQADVLAAALVGGAVSATFSGADLFAAPIVADAADEVGVGTRWFIGDTIDTDAYFDVILPTYEDIDIDQSFVNRIFKLENTTLPECWPLYLKPSEEFYGVIYEYGSKGVQFTGVIAPTYGRRITMKEKYTAPDMEIIEFDNEDVITTSNQTPELGE